MSPKVFKGTFTTFHKIIELKQIPGCHSLLYVSDLVSLHQKFDPALTIGSLHMVEVRIQYGCQSSSVEAHQDWPTHGHKAPDLPPSIHIRHNQIMSWSVLSHPVKTVKLFPYSQGSSESSYITMLGPIDPLCRAARVFSQAMGLSLKSSWSCAFLSS